jgi:hypothetical protein
MSDIDDPSHHPIKLKLINVSISFTDPNKYIRSCHSNVMNDFICH